MTASIALLVLAAPAAQDAVDDLVLPLVTARFELRSTPAVNQHHFLYRWAETVAEGRRPPRRPVPEAERERLDPDLWEPFEVRTWERAVAHYRDRVIARDLLFDEGMVAVKRVLAHRESWMPREGDPTAGERELLAAFAEAHTIYRHTWWPAHDRANRDWIAAVRPLLAAHEDALADGVARALGGAWPGRVRVDVSAYANWAGAYTTEDPLHVTIASRHPEVQGWTALEMLMHEPCHSNALERPLSAAIDAAFAAQGAEAPRELWHAAIFFTTGELTRRVAAANGAPDYVPFADRLGIYDRAWEREREALGRHWVHWLDGAATKEEVLAEIARDLAGG